MTWKEFKEYLDKLLPDDTPIYYIDVTMPSKIDIEIEFDPDLGVKVSS
jgi:hypothetical protein